MTKCILFILLHLASSFVVVIKGCTPIMTIPDPEIRDGLLGNIQCSIRSIVECVNIAEMTWEREDGDGNWDIAVRVDPSNNIIYETINGYNLQERGDSEMDRDLYDLFMDPAEPIDSGKWRCKAIDDKGSEYVSSEAGEGFMVTKIVADADIKLTKSPAGDLVAGVNSTFICICEDVYPQVNIGWEIDASPETGMSFDRINNYLWTLENRLTVELSAKQALNVKCIVSKTTGIPWTSSAILDYDKDSVRAPPTIENSDLSDSVVDLSSSLEMYCLCSGDNINIAITKDGNTLNETLYNERDIRVDGSFSFDTTFATNKTLSWRKPKDDDPCGVVERHAGEYACTANGIGGSLTTIALGSVSVEYKPTGERKEEGNTEYEFVVAESQAANITCPLCGNPLPSYMWILEEDRDEITGKNEKVLYIPKVTSRDLSTVFRCRAENMKGLTEVKVTLIAIGSNGLEGWEIALIVIFSILGIGLAVGGSYLGWMKCKKNKAATY